MAVAYLAGLGHNDIVFVAGPQGAQTSAARVAGFRNGIREAGLPQDKQQVFHGGWTADSCHDAVRRMWELGRRPDAILVVNVIGAVGVLSALHGFNVRIPQETSVIAIHDAWFAPHLVPSLTTVRMPLYRMGRVAAETLIASLSGQGSSEDIEISTPPPEIIPRASVMSRS